MIYIFPTDTVYGIGCYIFDTEAQKKIYELKLRPKDKPFAVLCSDISQIEKIAYLNKRSKKIIEAFMPGALTVILKSKKEVKDILGYKTIGVRIPNCDIALKLLEEVGPMTTTSLNVSGFKPISDYNEIIKEYNDKVDVIIKPDETSTFSNVSSTVIDLTTKEPKIIREGSITLSEILFCLDRE